MFVILATWTDMTAKTQASLAQQNPAHFCATHMICCAVVTSSQRAHGQPCLNHQRGLWHCIVRFIFHSTALVQSNQNFYSKNRGREKKKALFVDSGDSEKNTQRKGPICEWIILCMVPKGVSSSFCVMVRTWCAKCNARQVRRCFLPSFI